MSETPCWGSAAHRAPRIAVVILQYKDWQDTLCCLESVLASDAPPRWILVVDNASPNNAADKIREWAEGRIVAPPFQALPLPVVPKPIGLTEIAQENLEDSAVPETCCVLVRMASNRGYAAGNNAGLRLGLRWGAEAFWILNNDTS